MVFKKKRWFVGDRLGQKKITADLIERRMLNGSMFEEHLL